MKFILWEMLNSVWIFKYYPTIEELIEVVDNYLDYNLQEYFREVYDEEFKKLLDGRKVTIENKQFQLEEVTQEQLYKYNDVI